MPSIKDELERTADVTRVVLEAACAPWGGSRVCIDAYETRIRIATDLQLTVANAVRARADPLRRGHMREHDSRHRSDAAVDCALVPGRVSVASGFATAPDGGVPLYWESTGTGTPVLLIHGLGLSGGAWWRTVDALSPTMRVITFDHRGIGRSESSTPAYTTEAMADDAACVLDELGLDAVHVYGISLGGMVAQQLALRHPERDPIAHPRRDPARRPAGRARRRRGAGVLPHAPAHARQRRPPGPRWSSTTARGAAKSIPTASPKTSSGGWSSRSTCRPTARRCSRPRCTTATGGSTASRSRPSSYTAAHDRVIPVENAYLMAERLPDSRLTVLEDSGHLYPTEAPETDEAIGEFFGECDRAGALPASSASD